MTRVVLLAALVYLLLFAGVASLNGEVVALSLPLIVYLAAGLLRSPEEPKLSAERALSADRIEPGGTIIVTLKIINHGEALERMFLQDPLPPFLEVIEGSSTRALRLDAGESIAWTYTVRGRRGSFVFEGVRAVAEGRSRDRLLARRLRRRGHAPARCRRPDGRRAGTR